MPRLRSAHTLIVFASVALAIVAIVVGGYFASAWVAPNTVPAHGSNNSPGPTPDQPSKNPIISPSDAAKRIAIMEHAEIRALIAPHVPALDVPEVWEAVFRRCMVKPDDPEAIRTLESLFTEYEGARTMPVTFTERGITRRASVFHRLVMLNNHPTVNALLSLDPGLSSTQSTDDGATALHIAARNLNSKMAALLLAQSPSLIEKRDSEGRNCLHYLFVGRNSLSSHQAREILAIAELFKPFASDGTLLQQADVYGASPKDHAASIAAMDEETKATLATAIEVLITRNQ